MIRRITFINIFAFTHFLEKIHKYKMPFKRLLIAVKVTLLIILLILFCFIAKNAFSFDIKNVSVSGISTVEYSHFKEDKKNKNSGFVEFEFAPEFLIQPDNAFWSSKISPIINVDSADGIYQGNDILDTPETKRIFYLNEFFVNFDLNGLNLPFSVKAGKQLFEWEEGISFDFIENNPFSARDQSEPFLTLDDNSRLGVWGISFKTDFMNDFNMEFILNRHNNPILATDNNDMWTRDLPSVVGYGSMEIHEDVNLGLRLSGDHTFLNKNLGWGLVFYHGSSNAIDHVTIDGTRIHPVLPEQFSIGSFVQTDFFDFNVRFGASQYWLNGTDNYLPWAIEVDRFWEGLFRKGDNLFVEFGYAGVWTTHETNTSMEEIDMRRVLKNHFISTVEYEPLEGLVFKFKATTQRLDKNDLYFSPEIDLDVSTITNIEPDTLKLKIKADFIHSDSNSKELSFMNDLFTEHKNDDRISVSLSYNF